MANTLTRNTGGNRQGAGRIGTLYTLHQDFIEHSVIRTSEEDHFAAACDRTCNAECGDDRFGASVAEGHALIACHFAKHFGNFAGQRCLRSDFESLAELLFNCALYKVGTVAEHDGTEPVENVDVLIAVYIPQARTFGTHGDDGVDHFLPLGAKTGNYARVRKACTVLLRHALGLGCPFCAALD